MAFRTEDPEEEEEEEECGGEGALPEFMDTVLDPTDVLIEEVTTIGWEDPTLTCPHIHI